VGSSLVLGPKSRSFKISAFKGSSRHDDSGGRANVSKSLKNPVKVSYLQQEGEESPLESSKVQNVVPASYTAADGTTTSSLAIQNLFKKWLILLRTPSQSQSVGGALDEPCSTETSETPNSMQKQERGEILKSVWCYFLGLDATIKIPFLMFTPLYLAVNLVYGSEVSKELTPLWILGPLIVVLYIKMFRAICSLYIFSFKQTVKVVKNLPAYSLLLHEYIFRGKLKEAIQRHLWQPIADLKNMDYNELTRRKMKDFQVWLVERYLDFIELIWPYYCRTIRGTIVIPFLNWGFSLDHLEMTASEETCRADGYSLSPFRFQFSISCSIFHMKPFNFIPVLSEVILQQALGLFFFHKCLFSLWNNILKFYPIVPHHREFLIGSSRLFKISTVISCSYCFSVAVELKRMAAKMNSSFSCVSTYLSSPFQGKAKLKLRSRLGLFERHYLSTESLSDIKVVKSCKLIHGKLTVKGILSKRKCILFATSEDQQYFSELEQDDFEQERQDPPAENSTSGNISYDRAGGRPGFISFYGATPRTEDTNTLFNIEDSLLTDFLILFFTEALFYCGVAVFLLLIDYLRRPKDLTYAETSRNLVPHLGHRISSVAVLVLSLIIPMVTMGFVWPWTGPAASATLAPYLVGIVVQFAFEQYARYIGSPSWPAIPIVFQVYRLHQLNRAAQLVTALSFTLKGAEMTPHNLAINGSLSTLLNVLQFLGIICIWSSSSLGLKPYRLAAMSSALAQNSDGSSSALPYSSL
ncbi:UNVERIFIED_CONTAM: hypothetical protein Slati_3545600, partial [Sesamum latifolium]